jgi:hypothetical protein
MSEDKGGEYTKRLSQELKSSLYQRGQQEEPLWGSEHMAPPDLQVRKYSPASGQKVHLHTQTPYTPCMDWGNAIYNVSLLNIFFPSPNYRAGDNFGVTAFLQSFQKPLGYSVKTQMASFKILYNQRKFVGLNAYFSSFKYVAYLSICLAQKAY